MRPYTKIKSLIIGFSFALVMFECNYNPKELVNYKDSNHQFRIEVSKKFGFINYSKTSYGPDEIILENTLLKDCLPALLNKDKSLVQFIDQEKGDLLISAKYENFNKLTYSENSKNGYIKDYEEKTKETKKAFLLELKKALNFIIDEKVSPTDKYFQLIIKDSLRNVNQTRNVKNNKTNNSNITKMPGSLNVDNASIVEIADGLSYLYKEEGKFFAVKNNKNHYTINIKDIPFDQLKTHLEKEIGLSYVPLNEGKSSLRISKIVFNE